MTSWNESTDLAHGGPPAPLELLAIRTPRASEIIFAHARVFAPAAEFWSTFTLVRLVWAVPIADFFETNWPTGIYGDGAFRRTTQWTLAPLQQHETLTITADPLPASVQRITVILGARSLTLDLK